MNLQNTTIENEVISIDHAETFNAIGRDVVLKNCEIKIAVPTRSLGIRGKIIGGTIYTKRELSGFDWLDVQLDGVTFTGRYLNNRFGNFPPMYDHGSIANCDFTGAKLRDALFLNTKCDGVKFGAWPQFTMINSLEFRSSIEEHREPTAIYDYFHFLADYINDYCEETLRLDFMTLNAYDVLKRKGFDIDALREYVNGLRGLVC